MTNELKELFDQILESLALGGFASDFVGPLKEWFALLERESVAAIEEEREACAKIADERLNQDSLCVSSTGVVGATEAGLVAFRIARDIRARAKEQGSG